MDSHGGMILTEENRKKTSEKAEFKITNLLRADLTARITKYYIMNAWDI
jgi:hypothetical protein